MGSYYQAQDERYYNELKKAQKVPLPPCAPVYYSNIEYQPIKYQWVEPGYTDADTKMEKYKFLNPFGVANHAFFIPGRWRCSSSQCQMYIMMCCLYDFVCSTYCHSGSSKRKSEIRAANPEYASFFISTKWGIVAVETSWRNHAKKSVTTLEFFRCGTKKLYCSRCSWKCVNIQLYLLSRHSPWIFNTYQPVVTLKNKLYFLNVVLLINPVRRR